MYNKKTHAEELETFWRRALIEAENDRLDNRSFVLPLARIKRLMKVEEEVRMVASEVPIIFSKIAEKFVEELTLRAWINTDESKRRILQRNDLSVATRTNEMYDFLVYIIPRDGYVEYDGQYNPNIKPGVAEYEQEETSSRNDRME